MLLCTNLVYGTKEIAGDVYFAVCHHLSYILYCTFLHISFFTPELNGDFKRVWAPWRYRHMYFYLMEWFAHNFPAIIRFRTVLAACNCCKSQCNITYAQYCDCMFFSLQFFSSVLENVLKVKQSSCFVSAASIRACTGAKGWESGNQALLKWLVSQSTLLY